MRLEPDQIAIMAGAGAGKTTRMTERYAHHVLYDNLSPLEIVAVTFTEAAALELKSRVRQKLTAVLPKDDDRLAELEAARISTFHSLAAAICRQHANEAGVPGDFTILDEVQGALWLADRVDDALDTVPDKLFQRLGFTRARTAIRKLLEDPITADAAFKVKRVSQRRAIDAAREHALNELTHLPEWIEAQVYLNRIEGPPDDRLEHVRSSVVKAMLCLGNRSRIDDAIQMLDQIKVNVGSKKVWFEQLDGVKAHLVVVRESVRSAIKSGFIMLERTALDTEMALQVRDLRRAYCIVSRHLEEAKRRERVLDYSDLEKHAHIALQNSFVRAYYHERWHAFLVDEYQDTNRIQEEIRRLLMHDRAKLAIVGDANQSIYGFRRADPTLIKSVSLEIERGRGAVERLPYNRRTHPDLVEKLNRLFTDVFGVDNYEPQIGTRPDHPEAIEAGSLRLYEVNMPVVEAATTEKAEDEAKVTRRHRNRAEAANAARDLKRMFEAKALIADRNNGRFRPMQWSDVAVIARSWASLDSFADAFSAVGIPSVLTGGGNLMLTREARDGAALLRFLADPADNLALAAVLKSPFFTFSDLHLQLLAERSEGMLLDALRASENHTKSLARLDALLEARASESPSRMLHMASVNCGLEAILLALPGGERRLADWRGFVELITHIEKTSFDTFSVARVLRRLEMSLSDRAGSVEPPRPAVEPGNAISLMSIHRSKGLEWPIVVLPDLSRSSPPSSDTILVDPSLGIALNTRSSDTDKKPALYTLLSSRKKLAETEEEKRLLYVGATRARDYLLLTDPDGSKTGPGLKRHLMPSLDAAGAIAAGWDFTAEDGDPPIPGSIPTAPQTYFACTDPVFIPPGQIPVTGLATYEICPKQFEYRHVLGNPGLGEGSGNRQREGTLVHLAIQFRVDSVESLHRFDPTLPADIVTEALRKARYYRQDAAIQECRMEGRSEVPFIYHLEGSTLVGRIDLLGPDFVLDFKTGSTSDTAGRHKMQVWLYATAMNRERAIVYYFDNAAPHEFRTDNASDVEERVKGILTSIRAGEFTATAESKKCSRCRYLTICKEGQSACRTDRPLPGESE